MARRAWRRGSIEAPMISGTKARLSVLILCVFAVTLGTDRSLASDRPRWLAARPDRALASVSVVCQLFGAPADIQLLIVVSWVLLMPPLGGILLPVKQEPLPSTL
jgi:hypothetical protein